MLGLDGFVPCNCFKEGLTTPPPVPRAQIVEEEGRYHYDVPYAGHEDEHRAFDAWRETACPHPDFEAADEHLSNWSGYRLFQQALGHAGWERFPTLKAELPDANGGFMAPEAASRALEELAAFQTLGELYRNVCLIDVATDDAIFEAIDAYGGQFLWSAGGGLDMGVDQQGFYIELEEVESFRSWRFEQRLLEPHLTEKHKAGLVEFEDLDTGLVFRCRAAVPGRQVPWPDGQLKDWLGRVRLSYPPSFVVARRPVTPARFAYIIEPLERLGRAAIETGNPVCWM